MGGGLLRLCSLTRFSLNGDEAISALIARRIIHGHGPSFPSGLYEVRGELYWHLLGLWMTLTGSSINEVTLRILSSIFGIAGIWAIYALGKTMYNKKVGLLAASFYAFSPILIGLSRVGRMYSIWMFFLIIMFYLLCKGKIWPGILCFIASYYIHRGTLIFIPGIFMAICVINPAPARRSGIKRICYLLGLGLAIFIISIHLFHNPRLNITPAGQDTSNESFIRPSLKGASFYTEVLLGVRQDYIKKQLGEITEKKKHFDIGRFIMFALFWVGLMKIKREDRLLYGTFLTSLAIISFLVTWKWERYLAGLYPFLFIGSAKGVDILRKSSLITKYKLRTLLITSIFFVAVNPIGNTAIFEKRSNWAPDFRSAYRYIEKELQDGDIVVASESAPALFYLGHLDYFSQEEDRMIFLYRDRKGNIKERYSGKDVLDNPEQWHGLKGNKRIWFITDILKFPYKYSEETVSFIYNNFNLIESFYLVKIFLYEKGMKAGYMIRPEKEDLVPLEARFYYYSGDIRIRNGDVAGGVECFQISRQINPWYLLPYWRLGEIYTKVGLLEEGLKEYEKAYKKGKGDPLAKKLYEEALSERREYSVGEKIERRKR